MVKKNVEKVEEIKPSDDVEAVEVIKPAGDIETAEQPTGGIDMAEVIKATGGIEAAVASSFPMIEQIASQARSEAQRASAMAMREYRRRLHSITLGLQGTIRDEGARLAEQICARLTEQVRQAVLLQAEKKALNLVDEFVLGWQAEAGSLSQTLLTSEEPPESEVLPPKKARETTSVIEAPAPAVENKSSKGEGLKKQPEASETDQTEADNGGTENKVVFDFATFIARSKSPVKA